MSTEVLTDWDAVDRVEKAVEKKEKETGQRDIEGRERLERMKRAAEKNEKDGLISPRR